MRALRFALLLLLALCASAQAETLAYPSAAEPHFYLDIPAGWTGEPAEEMGGFMNLEGPTGILVSLRTVLSSEFTLDDVLKEGQDFVAENYTEVKWDAPKKQPEIWSLDGTGSNEGTPVAFSHLMMPVSEAVIFEIRMVADMGDVEGVTQGRAILTTVRSTK